CAWHSFRRPSGPRGHRPREADASPWICAAGARRRSAGDRELVPGPLAAVAVLVRVAVGVDHAESVLLDARAQRGGLLAESEAEGLPRLLVRPRSDARERHAGRGPAVGVE